MKLSAPKQMTWWISTILAVVAIIGKWIIVLPIATPYACIILLIAFIILWLGTFMKGF
ncbi:hypothetical protein GF337_06630 [candidate division KSB1 bacterium]|nr:hypothetical protein [candidate division KSB1 bacterium]